jgi:hypothetical protein
MAVPTPAMTAPWGTITVAQFEDYIEERDFSWWRGRWNVKRDCKPASDPACAAGTKKVKVRHYPEADAYLLRFEALDLNGHVVARLENRGDREEARYNLRRNTHTYMLVTPGLARFVYIDSTANPDTLAVASTFIYEKCPDEQGHQWPTDIRADFRDCGAKMPGAPFGPSGTNDPAWVSCYLGCCVVRNAAS